MNALVKKAQPGAETAQDPRWADVVVRNAAADGKFYYAVKTTGVYCRPSCGARLARPENVRFYATREEAEMAGFRPCKRCRPDQPSPSLVERYAVKITQACRIIEGLIGESETVPNLEDLAKQIGMSTYHFHRVQASNRIDTEAVRQRAAREKGA